MQMFSKCNVQEVCAWLVNWRLTKSQVTSIRCSTSGTSASQRFRYVSQIQFVILPRLQRWNQFAQSTKRVTSSSAESTWEKKVSKAGCRPCSPFTCDFERSGCWYKNSIMSMLCSRAKSQGEPVDFKISRYLVSELALHMGKVHYVVGT